MSANAPAAPAKEKPKSAEELGDDYFERHPDSPLESLHITSDGQIFPGTPRGENAAYNYKRDNANLDIKVTEYKR